jgi:hypothetical protein
MASLSFLVCVTQHCSLIKPIHKLQKMKCCINLFYYFQKNKILDWPRSQRVSFAASVSSISYTILLLPRFCVTNAASVFVKNVQSRKVGSTLQRKGDDPIKLF